jgi:hypothetical protein
MAGGDFEVANDDHNGWPLLVINPYFDMLGVIGITM